MASFKFKHVHIESYATCMPDTEVTSAELEDRIAPVYARLNVPFGTLEKLSGVRARRLWRGHVPPSEVCTTAGAEAIERAGFGKDQIGAVFNCSVTRDYFEPATACLVHQNLGLQETAMAMDITNACIGFSNGILTLATMIESGAVKAGLVVSGENISRVLDASIKTLLETENVGREELLKILPTFTLGSGAVAMVLAHESIASKPHKIVGAVSRSATQFSDLCEGNGDFAYEEKETRRIPLMRTESQKLIAAAAKLGSRMWQDASEHLAWNREDISHIYCHQVGRQVNEAFYREMGLDVEKEFTVYQRYGNLVSAALPLCFITGAEEKGMKTGEKVLLTAFGSGLNSIFTGIVW